MAVARFAFGIPCVRFMSPPRKTAPRNGSTTPVKVLRGYCQDTEGVGEMAEEQIHRLYLPA
jgi:hypothetical protein